MILWQGVICRPDKMRRHRHQGKTLAPVVMIAGMRHLYAASEFHSRFPLPRKGYVRRLHVSCGLVLPAQPSLHGADTVIPGVRHRFNGKAVMPKPQHDAAIVRIIMQHLRLFAGSHDQYRVRSIHVPRRKPSPSAYSDGATVRRRMPGFTTSLTPRYRLSLA